MARRSDVVVLCCGSSSTRFIRPTPVPSTTGEGIDLHDISLTGCQERLIRAVAATGKPVVLVLVAGKSVCHSLGKREYSRYFGSMVCRRAGRKFACRHSVWEDEPFRQTKLLVPPKHRSLAGLLQSSAFRQRVL